MTVLRAALPVFLVASVATVSFADDYLLQLQCLPNQGDPPAAAAQDDRRQTLEANVSLDRPFYVRSVTDGSQWVLHGTIEQADGERLELEYQFTSTELGDDPAPGQRIAGRMTVRPEREHPLGRGRAGARYRLTLRRFVPQIGFRHPSSGFSVRLVDEDGQPVTGARAGLYGVVGDAEWVCVVGPSTSDAEGVVRISEGRESLPELTFVAEHEDRGLRATQNLRRNRAPEYAASQPLSITMRTSRQPSQRPPGRDR